MKQVADRTQFHPLIPCSCWSRDDENPRILGKFLDFCGPQGYHPRDGLYHELKSLNPMFSPEDILKLMGPNTAAFIDRSDELGTLEPGKLADMVIVDGDPLELIFNLMNVEVVIKGGEIVVDKR